MIVYRCEKDCTQYNTEIYLDTCLDSNYNVKCQGQITLLPFILF